MGRLFLEQVNRTDVKAIATHLLPKKAILIKRNHQKGRINQRSLREHRILLKGQMAVNSIVKNQKNPLLRIFVN